MRHWQSGLAVLLLGLALTYLLDAWHSQQVAAEGLERLTASAEQRVNAAANGVQRRLASLDVLFAFFRANAEPVPRSFLSLAAALQRNPGVESVIVAEALSDAQSSEFENHWKAWYPDFTIRQRSGNGQLMPFLPTGRASVPIIYAALGSHSRLALGLDLMTEGVLAEGLALPDKHGVIVSPPFKSNGGDVAVMVMAPKTLAGRSLYFGLSFAPAAMREPYAERGELLRDVWLDVTDQRNPLPIDPAEAGKAGAVPRILARKELTVGNRVWRFESRLDEGAMDASDTLGQLQTWLVGSVASILAGLLVFGRGRARAAWSVQQAEVKALQDELAQSAEALSTAQRDNLRLTTILDTANEAVVLINEQGLIELFNAAAEQLFGYSVTEVQGMNVQVLMPASYRHRHDDALEKFVATRQSRVMGMSRELLGQRKNGAVFPIELSLNEFKLGEKRYFIGVIRDIADRKRAERMLFESEYKHRAILDAAFIGIYVQQDGRLRFVNPTFADYFKLASSELIEKVALEGLIANKSQKALEEGLDVVNSGGKPTELIMQRADGSQFYALFTAKPIIFDNQPGIAGSLLDISDLKAAEEAILKAEIKNVAILDAIPDLMIQIDSDGIVIDSRAGAGADDFGLPRDVIGQHYMRVLPPDLAHHLAELFKLPQRERPRGFEYRVMMGDQPARTFEARVTPMSEGEQLVMLRDISDRKAIEAELIQHRDHLADLVRDRTAELNSLFATSPLATALLSHRRVLEVNNAFCKLFGYHRDILIGQTLQVIYADEADFERVSREVHPALGSGDVVALEQYFRKANGEMVLCEVFGKAVDAEDPMAGSIWVFQDIGERRAAEVALKEAKNLAEAANQAKSEFLANMSHELRTPMHAVLSFAELGERRAETSSDERLLRYFERIRLSGHRLLQMLNDLLDLSKLDAGKMRYDMQLARLDMVAREVLDELANLGRSRGIHFDFVVSRDLPPVTGDPQRLAQVLRNLIANAVKFSPDDGTVTVTLDYDERDVIIMVDDEGVGIPADELERIFDKFIQSTKTKTGAGGTGLGLAISREIVLAHSGNIHAENRESGGARFVACLPRRA